MATCYSRIKHTKTWYHTTRRERKVTCLDRWASAPEECTYVACASGATTTDDAAWTNVILGSMTTIQSADVHCEGTRRVLTHTVEPALIFIFFQYLMYAIGKPFWRVTDKTQPYNRYDKFYVSLAISLLGTAVSGRQWKRLVEVERKMPYIDSALTFWLSFDRIAGRRIPDVSNSLSATATTLLHLIIGSKRAEAG